MEGASTFWLQETVNMFYRSIPQPSPVKLVTDSGFLLGRIPSKTLRSFRGKGIHRVHLYLVKNNTIELRADVLKG
jgi:hypothetical protein